VKLPALRIHGVPFMSASRRHCAAFGALRDSCRVAGLRDVEGRRLADATLGR
jgi:hypothetical protein